MKIKHTLKQVLLISFASLFSSCLLPGKEEKGIGYNSYTEKIEKNHLLIREQISEMSENIYNYKDTGVFLDGIETLMMSFEEGISDTSSVPVTRQDSLIYASDMQLNHSYQEIIMENFREMFHAINQETIDSAAIDSIKNSYLTRDKHALTYFKKALNRETTIKDLK